MKIVPFAAMLDGNIIREREMLCPDTGTSTMYFKITCNAGLLADYF